MNFLTLSQLRTHHNHPPVIVVFQTQRRVTFHLPDGSQESCSDSGLGDQEPSSTASTTQPLPLSFAQEEYYEQTSPNSRTEGDGNSDPESSEYHATFCQVFFPLFQGGGFCRFMPSSRHVAIAGMCFAENNKLKSLMNIRKSQAQKITAK